MNSDIREKRRPENAELRRKIDRLLQDGDTFVKQNLGHLDIANYSYEIEEAMEELSLEREIVLQLIEDYVIQILKGYCMIQHFI